MYRKIYLLLSATTMIFTCKPTLDSEVLEEDSSGATSNAAARVAFSLSQNSIQMFIADQLQNNRITRATVTFMSLSDIEFGAPDANGEASVIEDDMVVDQVEVELLGGENGEENLCPDHNMVAKLLQPDSESDAILGDGDVLCVGRAEVEMVNLTKKIEELSAGHPAFTYRIPPKTYSDLIKQVDSFYEKEKGGIIRRYEEVNPSDVPNPDIYAKKKAERDKFIIHRRMLKSYIATREALEQEGINFDDMEDNIIIPSVLNGLLNPRINVVRLSDNEKNSDNTSLEALVTKSAIYGGITKFLQYQHLFVSDSEFDSAKYEEEFNKIGWHGDFIDGIKGIRDRFASNPIASKSEPWINSDKLATSLIKKISTYRTFMQTETIDKNRECEDILDELYAKVAASSLEDENSESILFRTGRIVEKSGLHDPCRELTKSAIQGGDAAKGVKDIKKRTIDHLKELNKKYSNEKDKNNYLEKLLVNNYLAAVPVIATNDPDKTKSIAKVLAPHLIRADEMAMKKDRIDEFWQGLLSSLQTVLLVIGIASLVLFFFSPALPFVMGLSSLLALLSLGTGAFLAVSYGTDWVKERKEVHALEKAILTDNSDDMKAVAESLFDMKKARGEAITYGILTGIGFAPIKGFVADPRAFAQASPPAGTTAINLLGKIKSVPGKVAYGVRHPVLTLKSAWSKVKDAKTFATESIAKIRSYNFSPEALKQSFKNRAADLRNTSKATWQKNIAAWRSTKDYKTLKDMKKTILNGKGKIKINRDGKSGFIRANKEHLTPNREIKISEKLRSSGWPNVKLEDTGNNLRKISFSK